MKITVSRLAISLALGFLWIAVPATRAGLAETRRQTKRPAPPFQLKTISGKTLALSDFKGKVILLDFWATWCPPCRMSIPALVELNRKLKDEPVQIIGISLDQETDGVKAFADDNSIEYPVAYGEGSTVGQDYGIRALPTFVLIDKQGNLRRGYPGYFPGLQSRWESDIRVLLQENSAGSRQSSSPAPASQK